MSSIYKKLIFSGMVSLATFEFGLWTILYSSICDRSNALSSGADLDFPMFNHGISPDPYSSAPYGSPWPGEVGNGLSLIGWLQSFVL